jgi:hypothetical protein
MAKKKLTLYVEEKTGKLAEKISRLSGKSISLLVEEFFKAKGQAQRVIEVDEAVAKWIGILKEQKTYKELRDAIIKDRLRKYESSH